MKFDPTNWNVIKEGKTYGAENGRVFVRAPFEVSVYVSVEGVEALAGTGYEVDAKVDRSATYRCEAVIPQGGEAAKPRDLYVFAPIGASFKPEGEVFTNADRKPMESGTLAEVTKANRMLDLEHRRRMAEMRSAAAELKRMRKAAEPAPEPAPEPEPEPEPTPEPEE